MNGGRTRNDGIREIHIRDAWEQSPPPGPARENVGTRHPALAAELTALRRSDLLLDAALGELLAEVLRRQGELRARQSVASALLQRLRHPPARTSAEKAVARLHRGLRAVARRECLGLPSDFEAYAAETDAQARQSVAVQRENNDLWSEYQASLGADGNPDALDRLAEATTRQANLDQAGADPDPVTGTDPGGSAAALGEDAAEGEAESDPSAADNARLADAERVDAGESFGADVSFDEEQAAAYLAYRRQRVQTEAEDKAEASAAGESQVEPDPTEPEPAEADQPESEAGLTGDEPADPAAAESEGDG